MSELISPAWLEGVGFRRCELSNGSVFWEITLKTGECWLQLRPLGARWIADICWRVEGNFPLPRSLTSRRHIVRLTRVLGARIVKPRLCV